MDIAEVVRKGPAEPVTLFDTPEVIPADPPGAANWQVKRRRRARGAFLGFSGGVVGIAAAALLMLTPRSSAPSTSMPPATPQATSELLRLAQADPDSSTEPSVATAQDSTQMETKESATDSMSNAIVSPASRGEPNRPTPAAPEPPSIPQFGSVLLGTRGLTAVLYVDGVPQGAISRLRSWPASAGAVGLSIRMDGCTPWDSTIVVTPDQELRIGYRSPICNE